ncbi:MAG: serine/threonine protein kinase [Desulfobacterales bacterium]|nr:serine/threonine protein kinase [Desulfobacterales bacterium]
MIAYNNLSEGYRLENRYHILSVLGNGHSSTVYKALDINTETEVAVKILDPFLAQDPVHVERFRREVSIIGKLDHPNIIKIYDVFKSGEFHVICMEIAPGLDGKAYLKKNGHFSLNDLTDITRKLAHALLSCHDNGVVHRDLKPQNIIIDNGLKVKLLDFGISKINTMSDLTKTGTSVGTPEYMAPELFQSNHRWDPRSDIYSLGLVMYEFLTARPLFRAGNLGELLKLHMSGERETIFELRSDIPEWLDSILAKCLEIDPNDRYQTMYEVISDLKKRKSAIAHVQKNTENAICIYCKTEFLAGLNFCHQCGKFADEGFEKGKYSLILYDCDEKEQLSNFLAKFHDNLSASRILKKLKYPPVLLASKLSKETAARMVSDISLFPCGLSIVKNLPGKFQLPGYYFLLPISIIVFAPFAFKYSETMNALFFLFSLIFTAEFILFILYKIRTAPCLKHKKNKINAEKDSKAVKFASLLKEIKDEKIKALLGHILSKYFRINEKIRISGIHHQESELLNEAADTAFKMMKRAEQLGRYLKSVSLNELKENADMLSIKIEHSKDVEKTDKWIKMKSKAESGMAIYRDIEDIYSGLYTSVVQLNGFLKKYEDSIQHADKTEIFPNILKKLNSQLNQSAEYIESESLEQTSGRIL